MAHERWVATRLASILFRDGPSGCRAGLRSGPDIWEIMMVARDYGGDKEGLLAHFGGAIGAADIKQAFAYAARFPDEINPMIDGNEDAARTL